jgi:uncharacterized protein (DUF342 family)
MIIEDSQDGRVEITISKDMLEAWADLYPPGTGGTPITADYIQSLLKEKNISYGILLNEFQQQAFICNTSHRTIKGVLIARGKAAVDEIGEYYELLPNLHKKPAIPKGNYRINYKEFSPYTIVKKDQTLAIFHPKVAGLVGKNISSEDIQFRVVNPEGVSAGSNTLANGKAIVAQISGQLIVQDKSLNVVETLTIKGSVGYNTGHINFPGDVFITGYVADGFKIYSGGSVNIKQTLDLTDVVTAGDLNVGGGIVGRNPAMVKVNGVLRTKFIENCRVACRKDILVPGGIFNSSIFTLGRLDMGEKGQILGGDVYAIHGVSTGSIGRKSGKATRIHCGMDFTVQQEKDKAQNQLHILGAKLKKLQDFISSDDPRAQNETNRARVLEAIDKMEAEQEELGIKLSSLMEKVNIDEAAVVEIAGELAADTLIEICQVSFYVTTPLKKVRIHLDRGLQKLVSVAL